MDNFDENKMKPEEVSSGFNFGEQDSGSFGGKRTASNPTSDPSNVVSSDFNSGSQSNQFTQQNAEFPYKKPTPWKWILSISFLVLFLLIDGYFIINKFVKAPDFLNGNGVGKSQSHSESVKITEKKVGNDVVRTEVTKEGKTITIESTVESTAPDGGDKTVKKIVKKEIIETSGQPNETSKKIVVVKKAKEEKHTDETSIIEKHSKPKDEVKGTYSFENLPKKNESNKTQSIASNSARTTAPSKAPVSPQVSNEGPQYTIQVYSSPSSEDAQFWVQRLKTMGIATAYVSTQKIRDITWYRVRFGNYPTKEEAKSAASKFGFNQLWIDRIK